MVDEFIKLFTGYRGDFGIADMSRTSVDADKNKIKPNYEWAGRPLSINDYKDHLQGKISIGVQPCTLNKTAQFGCIDIDPPDYGQFKIEKYLSLFQQYKLPLIPILSKSGGLHCYIFLKEPIKAIDLIDGLKAFLLPLGLKPTTEIFPKQKELKEDEKGDTKPGNFINLPYYNNGQSVRYALDKNNSKLDLASFIKVAEASRISKQDLEKLVEETHANILKGADPEFDDGPPCLALCSKTKLDDGRDRFMYNYMVFAKKKYKDKWPDQVSKANYNYLEDPWDKTKLDSKIAAWRKDTAGHTCYEEPIKDKCMRGVCYSRPFGVSSDGISVFPDITDFQIIKYVWRNGCETIYPPKGTQIADRLHDELYQYCINGPQAKQRGQIKNGACYTNDGNHYFKFTSFIQHLGSGWKIPEERIARQLEKDCKVEFNHSLNVDGKTIKVCRLPQLHMDQIEYQPVERKESNY